MATYVLVHGGGHGGWCYGKLAPLLRAEGHLVFAPSLTGCGDRKHLLSPNVGLDTHITDVVNLLEYEDLTDVILLGHSYGGMVITGVADRAGPRIGQIVFLDASLPRDGEALEDTAPAMMAFAKADLRVVDGAELVLWPTANSARRQGVTDPHDEAWMLARLTPHPWKCFSQKLRLRDEAAMRRIPRTIINCTNTLRNRPEAMRARALEAERVWEIDTGHDLMITEPAAVAEMLLRLAALSG